MPLKATLYKSSKEANIRTDLTFVETKLKELSKTNKLSYNIVDTANMDGSERDSLYVRAILPSVWNKYRVRTIFGTNRHSGVFFGKEQPALLVEGDIWGIFPHKKDGKEISIENFLENLTKTME